MNKYLKNSWLESFIAERKIIKIIVIYGIIISLAQFFYNRGLCIDEAALALNIMHRSALELLKPLDYAQTAPPLFLLIEKFFSTLIPNSEYGLRLFPLLSFWASLLLFVCLVRKTVNDKWSVIIALTIFCSSRTFYRYSNEVKPYMTEMFMLLGIFWLTVKDFRIERAKYLALGIAGIIAVFLVNASPFILASSGMFLLYKIFACNERPNGSLAAALRPLLFVFCSWAVAAATYYLLFVHGNPLKEFMKDFWIRDHGFLILNPFNSGFADVVTKALSSIFSVHFSLEQFTVYPSGKTVLMCLVCAFAGLYVLGIIRIIKLKKASLLILFCAPVIIHLAMSALQLYPVDRRLMLYTFPGIIFLCSMGIGYILERIRQREMFCIIMLLILGLAGVVKFPLKHVETKACLEYIESKTEKGDKSSVYMLNTHLHSTRYYMDTGHVNERINIINSSDLDYQYLSDLILLMSHRPFNIPDYVYSFKGKTWFMLSNLEPTSTAEILNKLDSLGMKKLDEYRNKGVRAYLYDCGE
ncbi:MAG: DUF2723 domain-containing protein [Tannerellaceae bacterium]|jgi:hypothetical protein|nr:DUF2723 domain-containing protein [Tannerellaceae bacterium]